MYMFIFVCQQNTFHMARDRAGKFEINNFLHWQHYQMFRIGGLELKPKTKIRKLFKM